MDYDADKVRRLIGRRDRIEGGFAFGAILSAIGKTVAKAIPSITKRVIPAVIPKVVTKILPAVTKVVTKSITTGTKAITKGVATGATKGATKGFTSAASKKAAREAAAKAAAAKAATKADNAAAKAATKADNAAAKAVTEIPVAAPVPTSLYSKVSAIGSVGLAVGLPAYFVISGELAAAKEAAADARFKVQDAIDRAEAAVEKGKADALSKEYKTDYDADRKKAAAAEAAALVAAAQQELADAEAEELRLIAEAEEAAAQLEELTLQLELDEAKEVQRMADIEAAIQKALSAANIRNPPPHNVTVLPPPPPPPNYRPPPPPPLTYVDPYYDPPATYVPPPPRKRKGGMTLRVEDRPGYVDREAMYIEMEREFQQRMAQEDEQRRLDEYLRNPPRRRVVKGNPIPLIPPPTNTYTLGRLPIPKRNRKGKKGGFSMKTLQRDLLALGYSL